MGGVVLGIGMFAFAYPFCKGVSDTGGCLGYAAGAGAIMTFCGAVIGALIGGGFEKGPRETAALADP